MLVITPQLDLTQPLESQGPFDAIVHKVTDILAKADNGNATARQYIHNIQVINWVSNLQCDCTVWLPWDNETSLHVGNK